MIGFDSNTSFRFNSSSLIRKRAFQTSTLINKTRNIINYRKETG